MKRGKNVVVKLECGHRQVIYVKENGYIPESMICTGQSILVPCGLLCRILEVKDMDMPIG